MFNLSSASDQGDLMAGGGVKESRAVLRGVMGTEVSFL